MATDDTATLLQRVSLRDRQAFSALYRGTSSKLFGICLRILRDRAEAEEALQDVYIKIWQKAGNYAATETHPAGWLAAIARNHAIDVLRARKPVANTIDDAYDLADPSPDPEHSAMMSGEGRRIDNCMRELETDRADAVRKAYIDGHSYQELAEQFNIPLNTMRTWLRRSLLKLKECMER
ncbi:RNA polymerase sigma-70 factor (ECF subfamily) [Pararhizobium capsulatum DSM 1112]|uniref:RNA polymerase sigma-70 factor (ECF subfamily) n=1 Tax=Pararhizobium capsulatum DSM 1112 TaxID=1121113 RepID=A0ABU0BLJ1_9HYPH|nr:sigma-70 family RNA polymerase sigma factor [Pararhizobium capsulatum]MDQ0318788.1 RNA polymerase sigma-70 factor (ECF subfamily) [Pararhizobium capsulatum DSM 1112]